MQTKTLKLNHELENMETRFLIEAIRERYGYDLAGYNQEILRKELIKCSRKIKQKSLGALQDRILRDETLIDPLLEQLFFKSNEESFLPRLFKTQMRKKVLPMLKTYPKVKVWHLGCSDEALTLLFVSLLKEAELLDRTQIYATEMSENATENARSHYSKSKFKKYAHAISFFPYNFLSDSSFNEFQLILMSTRMADLDLITKDRVMGLIHDSSSRLGFLYCPEKNLFKESTLKNQYKILDDKLGLFQRRV